MDLFVGIDGGGTKTEFILFDKTGTIKNKILLEGTNPNDIGLTRCMERLTLGLDLLLDFQQPKAIFAGIAGVTTGTYIQDIQDGLSRRYHTSVQVDSDAANLLSLSKNPLDSAVLICGTGSCVFVRKNEKRYRLGGWGYLFDESGSGYDIGKDALRHTLAVYDGLEKESELSKRVEAYLGGNIWDKLSMIYDQGKPYIASLSKLVFETNDSVSKKILDKNADRLASLILSARKQYQAPKEFIGAGGLFNHQSFKEMIENKADIRLITLNISPVYGACIEALRLNNVEINSDFKEKFLESYR